MRKIDISFVIPVYNGSKSILRCLSSIADQKEGNYNYEIIIVDDGSTDNTVNQILLFTENNQYLRNRFNIILTDHNGPGNARNIGLKEAKGEYIWFVDADDEIVSVDVDSLVKESFARSLDILCFNISLIYPNGEERLYKKNGLPHDSIISGKEFMSRSWDYLGTAWGYIYRKSFLIDNCICFPTTILHEDELFSIQAFLACKRMMGVDNVCYKYYLGSGMIMSTSSPQRIYSLFQICEELNLLYERIIDADKPKLSYPILLRIIMMIDQMLSIYAKCDERIFINANHKKTLGVIKNTLLSSVHLEDVEQFIGIKVDDIIEQLEKQMK